MKLLRMKR